VAEVVGSVEERDLLEHAFQDPSILDRPVGDAMGPSLPTVGVGEPVELAVRRSEETGAVVVLDAGHPVGILTRSDLLGFLVGQSRPGR
jgi:cystathionine beta-synthase